MKPRRSSKCFNLRIFRRNIKNGVKEDRISSLPDCILVEIISRLPTTKQAIRPTCTLSKRWQHLWTLLPNLVFLVTDDVMYQNFDTDLTQYFSFIDKIVMKCHTTHLDLDMFKFDIRYTDWDNVPIKKKVISWIHYAISRNVKEVDLRLWDLETKSEFIFDDELFFNNSCFTRLKVCRCAFSPPLDGEISWSKLKCLCISEGEINEDMIGKILAGSPCLETLELNKCDGYKRIDITSKSVKNLVFSEYESVFVRSELSIEINAPYISSLTIQGEMDLQEISLINVSSLVNVVLDYFNVEEFRCLQEGVIKVVDEEMLRGLLQSLGHVNNITFGDYCSKVFSRLKDEGFQTSSSSD